MTHSADTESSAPSDPADGDQTKAAPLAESYVLVVDDEPTVREFLTVCLQRWGYSVQRHDRQAMRTDDDASAARKGGGEVHLGAHEAHRFDHRDPLAASGAPHRRLQQSNGRFQTTKLEVGQLTATTGIACAVVSTVPGQDRVF